MEDLPGDMQPVEASARRPREADSLRSAMEQYEREFIREQLIRNHYHRGRTAAALKIGEATLYRKMNEYGLSDLE